MDIIQNITIRLVMLSTWLLLTLPVTAQLSDKDFWNPEMTRIAKPMSKWGWIDLREDVHLDPQNFFSTYSAAMGLTERDRMLLVNTEVDPLGYTHYRYQQLHNDVLVDGGTYLLHVNAEGEFQSLNGKLAHLDGFNTVPVISPETALQKAMAVMGATEYMWQSEYWEKALREKTGNPDTSYRPVPTLVIAKRHNSLSWTQESLVLAYRIDINASSPHKESRYYIDAMTGESVKMLPLESNCTPATFTSIFNGPRSANTQYTGSTYRLMDDCQTGTFRVRNWNSATTTSNPLELTNASNLWTSTNNIFGATVLWEAMRAYAYFLNVHSRTSYDNANGSTEGYINAVFDFGGGPTTNNASMSFNGGTMKVGLGSSGTLANSWSSLDIIGHEYAHAVTGTSAALEYQAESGALNEAFSDVFGEMVESYTLGTCDYLMGQDRTSGAIRNLANPNQFGNPDTYNGTNWASLVGGDNGGVHTNSGVLNYWFWLLAEGGSGTNDNGVPFSVTAIDRFDARAIAFRALVTYLGATDQYVDMREGTLRAARDLYGACSEEEIQCGRAWYAVGVGTGITQYDYQICGTVSTGWRQGVNTLNAAGSCSVVATPSAANVIFAAANAVTLQTGFTATASGTNSFTAYLEPCSYTVWKFEAIGDDPQPEAVAHSTLVGELNYLEMTAYPNPFAEASTIQFDLPEQARVHLRLFAANGQLVNQYLTDKLLDTGRYLVNVDGMGLAAGSYTVSLTVGEKQMTKSIVRVP